MKILFYIICGLIGFFSHGYFKKKKRYCDKCGDEIPYRSEYITTCDFCGEMEMINWQIKIKNLKSGR